MSIGVKMGRKTLFCSPDVSFFFLFFTADDRSPVHSLHIPTDADDYTFPRNGETLKLRSEDQHNYTVLNVLGGGGCGWVFSAVRSDGLKVRHCI